MVMDAFLVRNRRLFFKEKTGVTNPTFVSGDSDLAEFGLASFLIATATVNREIPDNTDSPRYQNLGVKRRTVASTIDMNDETRFLRSAEGNTYRFRLYEWQGAGAMPALTANAAGGSGWHRTEGDFVVATANPTPSGDGVWTLALAGNISGAIDEVLAA